MSWIDTSDVAVHTYQIVDGKIYFAIELTKTDASLPTSSPPHKVCKTFRSYSQFRRLWKMLRERLNDPLGRHHHHQVAASFRTHKCQCAGDHCDFDALYLLLQSFPFPSRRSLRSKLTGLDHTAINARRDALAAFVTSLQEFFTTCTGVILSEKLQEDNCLVLKTYMNFLGAAEHFAADTVALLHRPLALKSWRQQCAEQMLRQDNDEEEENEDDGGFADCGLELSEIHLAAPRAATRRIADGLTMSSHKADCAPLPTLQVKALRVHTVHSFMEEFCEHVLTQFASDIDELKSPELTKARRWEICLYVACRIGHVYAVQLILFNYADANTAMVDGSSCLLIAARLGQSEIVALLMEEGADVNKANDAGVTSLIAACRNGCVGIVKMLLDAGAKVSICSKRGTYPLHAAIVSQNIEIVSILVEHGANVNVMTASGITPLHFAAKLGSLAISEYLLCHDADPEKRTKNDSDAMMIAEANGHATICELFQQFSGLGSCKQVGSDYMLNISESNKSPDMMRMFSRRRLSHAII
uniref:Uncharacterized protein n=1 Tax=Hyaloperonospora arabidopsidis (strain Emoy2) TaxID=559515 RepID=M4C2G8_HYAAE